MEMYNPPHPGEVIKGLWLEPEKISITEAAKALAVSRKTLSKIINGKASVTPEMAVRLSIALGGSAESWIGYQVSYDLWQVKQYKNELGVHALKVA
ncbi:antitoxin HigA-1 [Bathymodiolus japonicus methanotrophic gill symbiont]|uniref:HigA family addiction module antitoxin n=1 Tax=Bathymodiolus japonicus methanotrophic gill symbiont TaxID=113269 RepID=UPI001B53E968|nr:HigA family addiction module antitoxin [Bathymodiolus japonicus methanotrophic gill symbiont]GFO71915.1 antitoxin HigA-1 [Bathymodiolus japonicus methanotrophic gill symbiont]